MSENSWIHLPHEQKTNLIREKQISLAKEINEYSKSQVDYWRQIPYECLRVDGYSGWSGTYATAYSMGLWRLESGQFHGGYHVTVDLMTGELCFFNKPINYNIHATTINRLDLEELDAKATLLRLVSEDISIRCYTNIDKIKENQAWYSHIDKIYTRNEPIPDPYYGWD